MSPFELGQFIGAFVPCVLLRALGGWLAKAWSPSVTRLAFLNLLSFLLASWLMAHGSAISRGELTGHALIPLSMLHVYLLPQLIVFLVDVGLYFVRHRKPTREEAVVRKEPTF
jgi:hypothetical protein